MPCVILFMQANQSIIFLKVNFFPDRITCIIGVRLKFISPLEDQTVKEGETATFVCELSHEKMHVVWFKNDAKLHTSRTVLISSEGKTHKLEMREVTLDDISQIKAQVKDLSSTAHLKVLGKCDQL